ncbi:MAG: hypothetical protein HY682_10635 [Chloroflexi bacterium]|nr:hypothetical protein [Chloroflexota bacterium]
MGVAASMVFIAAGAILAWAVSAKAEGIDIQVVGIILFIIGAVGLLVSLIYWSTWGGWGWSRPVPPPVAPPPPHMPTQMEEHEVERRYR